MEVAVIGGGGREHALIWQLSKSSLVDEIYALPGNGGIEGIAECVDIKADDIEGLVKFSKNVDVVVVGPENPLSMGIIDLIGEHKAFGPNRDAALIESSKAFAKELMRRMDIPTATFDICSVTEEAIHLIKGRKFPFVIKASGLAAGKGAFVVGNKEEARDVIIKIMEEKILGNAGNEIVIEDFLEGEEVSLLAFTDGKYFEHLLPSQDHKRLLDGDNGPNTGGMGAYSPVSFISREDVDRIIDGVIEPVVYGLNKEGIIYKGILYAGLIITDEGPKVLEFNARFGDPETQAILPLMDSDIMELILATIEKRLGEIKISFRPGYATCVVLASSGYPGKYEKGKEITGLDNVEDAVVFHAGSERIGERLFTSGGRVLGVTAIGNTLKESFEKVYKEAEKIHFDGVYMRKDIGRRVGSKQ
ncbi:phosphoribosylamine--glycine ligase [candidate division WOR-3 bacterium]|nr:phosphoribosylamine--glycine ligase [candidate division WOR-3 bacterium]